MKILTLVARILMGLTFLVFGLNGFLHFLPMGPAPQGIQAQFMAIMGATHYLYAPFALQIICGLLFLINRYIPLALTLICPVIVNILLFHALMAPASALPGVFVTVCWLIVYWSVRPAFRGIFQPRPTPTV